MQLLKPATVGIDGKHIAGTPASSINRSPVQGVARWDHAGVRARSVVGGPRKIMV